MNARPKFCARWGFVETGVAPQQCSARGEELPSADMLLTRADWLAFHGLPIGSEWLLIRPLSIEDVPDLKRIAGNDVVVPMLAYVQSPWSQKDAETWVNSSQFSGRLGFRLGIVDRASKSLLGVVGVGPKPASLMYFVDQDHWGKGIASEACHMVLNYAFDRFAPEEGKADCFYR